MTSQAVVSFFLGISVSKPSTRAIINARDRFGNVSNDFSFKTVASSCNVLPIVIIENTAARTYAIITEIVLSKAQKALVFKTE